jgi:transcriptional regulator with XRE-family HTH domain
VSSPATTDLKTTVGLNIRVAREAKGWTQRDLAARVGVVDLAVSRWERGVAMPQPEHLMRLSVELERETSWFFEARAAA